MKTASNDKDFPGNKRGRSPVVHEKWRSPWTSGHFRVFGHQNMGFPWPSGGMDDGPGQAASIWGRFCTRGGPGEPGDEHFSAKMRMWWLNVEVGHEKWRFPWPSDGTKQGRGASLGLRVRDFGP